jgi:short-subunit dehydrogenase
MKLTDKTVLITGAAGGIGRLVVQRLVQAGARVAMLDRNGDTLEEIRRELADAPGEAIAYPVDLLDRSSRDEALRQARQAFGTFDLIINNAGMLSFRPFAEEDPVLLERMIQLNLATPMLIIRTLLPDMLEKGGGRIVNIGSTFGSIGFGWFAAYSASKAGLRGLSEALRRELGGSGVGVTYIAPRAVRTPLDSDRVMRMAEATGMNMDDPEWVADQIVAAIEKGRKEVYLGFPESLFVRINAILPRLVDLAVAGQMRVMGKFAREG